MSFLEANSQIPSEVLLKKYQLQVAELVNEKIMLEAKLEHVVAQAEKLYTQNDDLKGELQAYRNAEELNNTVEVQEL